MKRPVITSKQIQTLAQGYPGAIRAILSGFPPGSRLAALTLSNVRSYMTGTGALRVSVAVWAQASDEIGWRGMGGSHER